MSRHQRIRAELQELLTVWTGAGVMPLLFKGFWLSEFVYPVPGVRFHGDVDVLIPSGRARTAVEAAAAAGWDLTTGMTRVQDRRSHIAFGIEMPGGSTRVDGHHLVLHSRTRWNGPQARVTAAVWQHAVELEWEGLRVHGPDPVDSLLILVLQRSWGDRWGLKPADVLDLRHLIDRHSISPDDVWRRARDFRCERTLRLFLARCDPWTGVLDLGLPSRTRNLKSNIAVLPERPTLLAERGVARVARTPAALLDAARVMPAVLAVWRALRRGGPIPDLVASLTPRSGHSAVAVDRARIARGVRVAVRLLRIRPHGACLVRALAVYRLLRQQGLDVDFVSGVRRDTRGVQSHAWVELDGRILPELREPPIRVTYTENFRYPARAGTSTAVTD